MTIPLDQEIGEMVYVLIRIKVSRIMDLAYNGLSVLKIDKGHEILNEALAVLVVLGPAPDAPLRLPTSHIDPDSGMHRIIGYRKT